MADDVYQSRYAGYQIIVQGAEPIYAPGTGILIGRQKELVAEFGKFMPEVQRVQRNPETGQEEPINDAYNGTPLRTAVIYGHVFDLQLQAKEKGWKPEEIELVKLKVEYQCELTPNDVWRRSKAKAPLPWPSYDETHHSQVAKTAEIIGSLAAALTYEQENKNRPSVVKDLEDVLNQEQAAGELVAS